MRSVGLIGGLRKLPLLEAALGRGAAVAAQKLTLGGASSGNACEAFADYLGDDLWRGGLHRLGDNQHISRQKRNQRQMQRQREQREARHAIARRPPQ